MQCNVKTSSQNYVFKLSTSGPIPMLWVWGTDHWSVINRISDRVLNAWPSVKWCCLNSSTSLTAQVVDRPAPVALPRFCNPKIPPDCSLGYSEATGWMLWWSPACRDAGALRCIKLSWFSVFDFIQNTKHAGDDECH